MNKRTTLQLHQLADMIHDYLLREERRNNAKPGNALKYPVVCAFLNSSFGTIVNKIVSAVDYNASMSELHNLR